MSWNLTRQSSKLQPDITESKGTCCRVSRKPLKSAFFIAVHFPQHIFWSDYFSMQGEGKRIVIRIKCIRVNRYISYKKVVVSRD